jgi:hypothetical protein
MKNIISIVCALFVFQICFAQKMIIHTKSIGNIEVELGKIDSITFTTSGMPGGLFANPSFIGVPIGNTMTSKISGGMTPYKIEHFPMSSIATASLNGDVVTIAGIGVGNTSVGINDNSIPPNYVEVYISVMGGPGGLIASSTFFDLEPGISKTAVISGGTTPYSIQIAPDPMVATASISGSTVTINGIGGGNTYFVVKDNSSPFKSVTIDVRVKVPFTSPGNLAFTSTVNNFSANGIFLNSDSLPSNTQGVGGWYMVRPTDGNRASFLIIGYYKNSDISWDIIMIDVQDSLSVKSGSYSFLIDPMIMKRAMCRYVAGWNPNIGTGDDPFNHGYRLTSGSLNISALTANNGQGIFNGSGVFVNNEVPDPTKPITITNGTFNVPIVSGEPLNANDQRTVNRLMRMAAQKYSRR